MTVPLILASASPYRQAVLKRLGLDFETRPADLDETPLPGEPVDDMVERLALGKAQAVAEQLDAGLVIGCDQTLALDGEPLGKPGHHAAATAQLRALSGREAVLVTGLALVNAADNETRTCIEHCEARYRTLSDTQIEAYLQADTPYDCCGSVKLEARGIALLHYVRSDDPNILVGMPVIRLLDLLEEFGYAP